MMTTVKILLPISPKKELQLPRRHAFETAGVLPAWARCKGGSTKFVFIKYGGLCGYASAGPLSKQVCC